MQRNKGTKRIGLIKEVAATGEILTDSLAQVCDMFKLKDSFGTFDDLKSRGYTLSSLLTTCTIMPFIGVASIYSLFKHGIIKEKDITAKKDAFYEAKNNENIDWRCLLYLVAKRYKHLLIKDKKDGEKRVTAIVFDDTFVEKTGKGIEKVSVTYDHVTKRFILGFKILVCGYWDGESFMPLDFSMHRERGSKREEVSNLYIKSIKTLRATKAVVLKQEEVLSQKQTRLTAAEQAYAMKPSITNKKRVIQMNYVLHEAKNNLQSSTNQLIIDEKVYRDAKLKLKRIYSHGHLFGLTAKERERQYKKLVSAKSYGYTRRREADMSKGKSLIVMLKRAVKRGFIPRYVLTDSWFFSESLISNVKSIKNGCIDLISMVKINNQVFNVGKEQKDVDVKTLLKNNERLAVRCKKLNAKYIKIDSNYKGMAVRLFFVKMGRTSTWHLIATTDMTLSFIALMEAYQIRWSVEIFFKESKQYLNLGQCKSSNFDAQIADTTIAMIQYTMLSYCKRINYQTSFGDLFKGLNDERMQYNLLTQLKTLFWKLVDIFCFSAGFDFITIQRDMMQNQDMIDEFAKLIPEGIFNKAA